MSKSEYVSVHIPEPEEVIATLEKGLGTCYCFMLLEEKWENMPREIMDALDGDYDLLAINGDIPEGTKVHFKLPSVGVMEILDNPGYLEFNGKEGINRMSVQFCSFGGGIVMASESGQDQTLFFDLGEDEIILMKN